MAVECFCEAITKVSHNKPISITWKCQDKLCSLFEFTCQVDLNTSMKTEEKMYAYFGPLQETINYATPSPPRPLPNIDFNCYLVFLCIRLRA